MDSRRDGHEVAMGRGQAALAGLKHKENASRAGAGWPCSVLPPVPCRALPAPGRCPAEGPGVPLGTSEEGGLGSEGPVPAMSSVCQPSFSHPRCR